MITITAGKGKNSVFFYSDAEEYSGVQKIAARVRHDVELVTDIRPPHFTGQSVPVGWSAERRLAGIPAGSDVIVYGTLATSPVVTELLDEETRTSIEGKREVYVFRMLDTPFAGRPDLKNVLVIAGSDKRGSIYGLFHLSELLGVSPLVDWCGLLPAKKPSVTLGAEVECVSKEPSVRFRGFFINDEWPAFGNWCNKRFGGFNAKCYEHVFELLLRLKGNYMWPAMWSAQFSLDGPGLANAELADELGVIMGASHHEPCCRNGEEYKYLRGPGSVYGDAWNFRSNPEGITRFWEDGLKRSGKFENVITVGMRGEADTAIMKNATLADNIQLLRDVLKTQNNLIRKYVNPDVMKVPRMIALYKEVEEYFYGDSKTKGLRDDPELEGVTIMLCEDNHGNLRTVPDEKMRRHKGGYGMYYHFDYHGWPYSFEWFNTTHLAKVKEQMCHAYDFGIQDLWIVNVGDIMTNEFSMSYFLNLAYDYEKYSSHDYTIQQYTRDWIAAQYPFLNAEQRETCFSIMDGYAKLAHTRRTESLKNDTYHPVNFGESDATLAKAEKIIADCEKLRSEIAPEHFPGFYEEVYLPACANMNVLRMQLYSGKNVWFAKNNLIAAAWYADRVKECIAYDRALVDECDTIDGGRWYGEGWSEHFGFVNWCEAENRYPVYMTVEPTRKERCVFWLEGDEHVTTGQDWTDPNFALDAFKDPTVSRAVFKAAACSEKMPELEVTFASSEEERFLSIEKTAGFAFESPDVVNYIISIDREKSARSVSKKDVITFRGNDGHGGRILAVLNVDADVPAACGAVSPESSRGLTDGVVENPGAGKSATRLETGTFVDIYGYVSIEAAHASAFHTGKNGECFRELPGYGKTLSAVKAFPVTPFYRKYKDAPSAEYRMVLGGEGVYAFDFYMNPSNPAARDNKLQFVAEINGKPLLCNVVPPDFAVGDNQYFWADGIENNIRITTVYEVCRSGVSVLKVYPVTPGIVLEKIVVHPESQKIRKSYLGAPETYRIP